MSLDILVTGCSGYVGSTIVRELHARGVGVGAFARDPERAKLRLPAGIEVRQADYENSSSLLAAFQGVSQLVFVPSDGFASSVLLHVRNVIEAAQESKIGRVIFLSIVDVSSDSPFYYTPVYRVAESLLLASGLDWTILRSGLYSDLIRDAWLLPAQTTGSFSLPAGEAKVAPISRDDVAHATAAASTSALCGEIFSLTGGEAMTFPAIARAFSELSAQNVEYQPISPSDYLLRLWADYEDPWPHAFSTLLASVAQGRFADVSEGFQWLTGRSPEPFGDWLGKGKLK